MASAQRQRCCHWNTAKSLASNRSTFCMRYMWKTSDSFQRSYEIDIPVEDLIDCKMGEFSSSELFKLHIFQHFSWLKQDGVWKQFPLFFTRGIVLESYGLLQQPVSYNTTYTRIVRQIVRHKVRYIVPIIRDRGDWSRYTALGNQNAAGNVDEFAQSFPSWFYFVFVNVLGYVLD